MSKRNNGKRKKEKCQKEIMAKERKKERKKEGKVNILKKLEDERKTKEIECKNKLQFDNDKNYERMKVKEERKKERNKTN